MKIRQKLLCALLGVIGANAASADPVLWFSDSSGRLGTVDLDSGTATLIGNMGVQMTDIAFSPTGELFGTTFNALYRINASTGATTLVGNHGDSINALVFAKDGTLYGAGSALYSYDTSNGQGTFIGSLGATSSGDLAFVGGELYLSAVQGGDSLRRVNTATGASTLVGNIGRSAVYGLASPNGVDLYGMSGSSVFDIDVTTGAAGPNIVSFAGFSATYGTTFFEEARPPVPEPSSYLLMAAGLGLLVASTRRRGARS